MIKTITVFHIQPFLKLGCWIFKNINNYVVQGLQSYKWVCLKCGNIIWYIPAIIGVKHQRWLKSCSLKWKILLREGTKSCYIRDGHCIKLLTFQYACNCWIKRIEHEYANQKGVAMLSSSILTRMCRGQSFGSMKVMHCCRIERSFAHPGELDYYSQRYS